MEPITKDFFTASLKELLNEQRFEFERVRTEAKETKLELKKEISLLRRDMIESFVDLGEVIRSIGARQEDHEDRICILEKA